MTNGSIWFESVGPQDEGHYLCRATNGIGSGLGKVIYVGVNEPARFDLLSKNVSVTRGNQAILLCQVYGDLPIDVAWTHNGHHMDPKNFRYSISDTKAENGVKSQVTITRADREYSGVYKCLAENAYGRSEHVINLGVQERPDPPSMLEVVEVSSRSVRLTWKRPFDGNSPVIGYLVQYQLLSSNHQGDWEQSLVFNLTLPPNNELRIRDDPLRETAVISTLQPATVYTMRMLAVNSIDQSSFTEPIIVRTQEEAPSEAPKDVKVDAVSPGELFLIWSIPPRESWNGELLGYIVTWSENEGLPNNTKSMTVKGWATNKLQLTGLKKFTRYDITVRAFNSVSAGPTSATVIGTTKEGVPEAAPQNIMCSEISSQIMKISWNSPPTNYHGGMILGYKVFYRPVSSDIIDIPTTGEVKRTSSSETYLHGLYKFTNYSIKVLAYTGAGDGAMSQSLYCTTEEDLPGPPMNIKAAALTGESILVSWLSPNKPNGRIILYTIYCREAGRVGKHTSYNMKIEDMLPSGLAYQARNLKEHQLYEFWVSATTSIGEGEPTSIVAQATNSRAPSKIVSFSQILHKPDKSKLLLPCTAVGNPTPWTKWIHRDRPITFSPFYEVTTEGHLKVHSLDSSLAGNYTCLAKNLFGEDEITYTLIVLLPPSSPSMEIQFTTTTNIRLHWNHPEDGGTVIQGYTLHVKHDSDDWTSIELSPEHSVYTLESLRCGSLYHIYLLAHNRVGNGSPSPIQTVKTKGGHPMLPKEKDFIITNSTTLQLNLYNWPDGGCPIMHFSIQYKAYSEKEWILIAKSVSEERIVVHNLLPATWYQLRVTAENDAGHSHGFFNFATTTLTGEQIPIPTNLLETNASTDINFPYKESLYVIIPLAIVVGIISVAGALWWLLRRKNGSNAEELSQEEQEVSTDRHHRNRMEEKTIDRDNRKNCQQVYMSSPVKSSKKLTDEASGTYEISPYATFNVPVPNKSRSVNTSTLDYTMQFKTFGHIEDEDHNTLVYPKNLKQNTWQKNRYYSSEAQNPHKIRQMVTRLTRGDSESDDTSGSPCGDCPGVSNYRVPIKPPRNERQMGSYPGYETLLVADLFRPDSSTESNDVSPLAERRLTPKHVGGRKHHRPTSSSRAMHTLSCRPPSKSRKSKFF